MNYIHHFVIYHDDEYTKEATVFYTGKTGFLEVYITETYEDSVIEPVEKRVVACHTGRRYYRVLCKKLARM